MTGRSGHRRLGLCGRGWLGWVGQLPAGRAWAALVLLLVSSLTVSLLREVPAFAAPRRSPDAGSSRSVPVRPVAPRAATRSATDGRGLTSLPHKTSPPAASGTVPVSGVAAKVGDLPVAFGPAASLPAGEEQRNQRRPELAPASVQVRVLDRATTNAAVGSGPLLALTRADGVNASGRVRVRLDYQGFADAFGGDQAGRLRLVKLPECALSTPDVPSCQARTYLDAVNAGGALSADVTLDAGPSVTAVAVVAGVSSGGGTFEATSLSQAYSWAAGSPSGSFAYSYRLPVPPAGVGPQPNLALTYDSGVVDGQTLAQNGQASWVGEGWDLQVGYVERAYRPCAQDDAGSVLVGDLCWFSQHNATMLFGGRSLQLVRDNSTGVWRAANDDGLRVEKLNDTSLGNGDNDGEYWKVTTQDGTQYFFGKNKRYKNDNEKTNSVQTVAVYGDDPGDPCANGICREAYRWNLDYVVDPRGNTMTYVYNLFQGRYSPGTAVGGSTFLYDLAANLAYIDYGDVAGSEHSQPAPMRVQFETTNRCVGACGTKDYPDTPLDLYCAPEAFSCGNRSPVFFNNKKLSSVTAMVLDPSEPPKYRTVDKWVLSHIFPDTGDNIPPAGPDTPPNLWLQSIEHTGYGRDGTPLPEPKIEFGGEMSANRVDWGADKGVPPYMHYRLSVVRTGTGGETLVTYARNPDGGVECHRAWAPIPDNNPHLCFPQTHKPHDADAGFGWFHKYLTKVVRERDLTGGSPDEWTFYSYANDGSSDSALWYHDFNESVRLAYRTWSLWRGYSTVTATKEVSEGIETASRNLYHRGMDGDGKVTEDGLGVAWGGRRAGLLAPVGTPGVDGAISGQGGRCLDIVGPSDADGTPVQLSTCNDSWGQVWDRQPDGPFKGSFKNEQSGKCLDVAGSGTANGTPIQLSSCTGAANQVWQPRPDGSLKNPQSGKCADLTDFGTADGTRVQLWDCTGNWNQVWQPQAVGRKLSNPQANRCVDIEAGTANGAAVRSWVCAGESSTRVGEPSQPGAANQLWQWQPDGSLKNPQSGRCLDISSDGTTSGTKVQLWDCTGAANQVWQPQADGGLKNPQSGKCLEAGVKAYGQLFIDDCNGGLTQMWVNRFLDARGLHGFLRDGMSLDGASIASSIIHVPTATPTATRAAPVTGGQALYADMARETLTKTRTRIAADNRWRWTEARASYDSYGLPTDTADLGDTDVADDDTCVRTEYARNNPAYLISYPWQVSEYAGACGSATVLARSQTFYDHATTLGVAPTKGLATRQQMLVTPTTWSTTNAGYDNRGRPVINIDARGQITLTSYTPSQNLPIKEVTVSNPLNHTAKVTFDPGRGQPTQMVDANGKLTTVEYDPLGRRTAVWLPSEKKANGAPPSLTYQYEINTTAPHKLTTRTLQTRGTPTTPAVYLTSYKFLDGRLRTRNTQVPSPAGGRIITETSYDSRGQLAAETGPMFNLDPAGSGMVTVDAANVPSRTMYGYDNLQRMTAAVLQSYGAEKWRTTYQHDGDRTKAIPPSGGPTTTKWDVAGRTTSLTRHPAPSTDESAETTRYKYNAAGELVEIRDAAGNTTTYDYDLAGNRTQVADLDTGTSTSTYNVAGDLTSTTDARGQKLSYQYDVLGRVTARWAGEVGTGSKLATFSYDSLAKGQLASATRFVGADEYKIEPIGYDDRYRPTGTRWSIPASEGALKGSYETSYGYDGADHLTSITYGARGGLPAETVATGYDTLGFATTVTGAANYVTATGYDPTGQLVNRTYGDAGPGQLIRGYSWDPATGRLDSVTATLPNPAQPGGRTLVQDDRYSYQPAGDISSVKDNLDGQSQCYRYDGQHRLTEAYTTLENCTVDPTNVAASGKYPYWDSFAFDSAGRRTADTHRTGTAITGRTYTYPSAGQPRTHAMGSVAVDTSGSTRTDTFGYDAAGNMKTRTVQGVKSDYTINAEGRFETATVTDGGTAAATKHVYDPDGGLLIRNEPSGRSLYLGGEELKTSGGNTVTGTRYYTQDGTVVAARTSAGVSWLAADHQASASLTVDPTTGAVQRRWYLPYGADRTQVTGWPTDRGFLNAQTNVSTKLLDVGAREYDPDTGTFIAPDPFRDPSDPASFNPYAYAHHNPVTFSDPTGLSPGGSTNTEPSSDDVMGDRIAAIMVVAALVVLAVAVCAGTAGVGCAVMAGAAIGAGFGAALAEPGERARGALLGGVAGAIGGGVGGLLAGPAGIAAASATRLAAAGVAAGVAENVTNQYLSTGTVDWRQTVVAGALGGVLGPAGKVAAKFAGRLRAVVSRCATSHSFDPTTGVLMADGSTKPIEDVELGEQVVATDPETGEQAAKPVTQLHENVDADLTDVTVQDGETGATTVLHTTQHHPFWDATDQQWVDAGQLQAGHQLLVHDDKRLEGDGTGAGVGGGGPGAEVTVLKVDNFAGAKTMRDLTVADTHTYYVIASGSPVLVHNCTPVQVRSSTLTDREMVRPSFRYQAHATGTRTETTWRYNDELTEVDGDAGGWLLEAKWTGGRESEWASSVYNPNHEYYRPDIVLDQARRLLDLAAGLDRRGVIYMVSNKAGADHLRQLLGSYFEENVRNGTLRVFHVPGDGM